jgi:hypothetical protein
MLNEVAKWAKNPREENNKGDRSQERSGTSLCFKRKQLRLLPFYAYSSPGGSGPKGVESLREMMG